MSQLFFLYLSLSLFLSFFISLSNFPAPVEVAPEKKQPLGGFQCFTGDTRQKKENEFENYNNIEIYVYKKKKR